MDTISVDFSSYREKGKEENLTKHKMNLALNSVLFASSPVTYLIKLEYSQIRNYDRTKYYHKKLKRNGSKLVLVIIKYYHSKTLHKEYLLI